MPDFPPLQITEYWREVHEDFLRIIDLVPADKWNWTPDERLWNARGIIIHAADARDSWMTFTVQDGNPYPNIWATARTLDDIRREHERTWARLQRFLSNQSALDAAYKEEDRNGNVVDINGHWIAFHLLEHDIHHRAELLQRLALLGVEHGIDF